MDFFTRFNPPVSQPFVSVGPSMTQQHFAQECDVNYIVKRCVQGIDPFAERAAQMQFVNCSEIPDFRTAQDTLLKAGECFDSLSSDVRRRFNNSPVALLDFLSDPANRDEAVRLGLCNVVVGSPVEAVYPALGDGGKASAE